MAMLPMDGETNFKTIATAEANLTYAQQLKKLYDVWVNLDSVHKENSIISVGGTQMRLISASNGGYSSVIIDGTLQVIIRYVLLSNQILRKATITGNGSNPVVENISNESANVTASLSTFI